MECWKGGMITLETPTGLLSILGPAIHFYSIFPPFHHSFFVPLLNYANGITDKSSLRDPRLSSTVPTRHFLSLLPLYRKLLSSSPGVSAWYGS